MAEILHCLLDGVIIQFLQIMQLARPLPQDMDGLQKAVKNLPLPENTLHGFPYKSPWTKEDYIDLRALQYSEPTWSDRLGPTLSKKIEAWKNNKTFSKFAKVLMPRNFRYILENLGF